MHPFAYHRPNSIAAAAKAMATAEDGRFLAGGMTLIPVLKQRLARHSDLIDISRIDELRSIRVEKGALVIGATARHAEVAASRMLATYFRALAHLADAIGDAQVRNRGTIGGSIANNDPASDYPASLLALNATVVTERREIPADAFFKGLFETALEPGELIVSVRFPAPEKAGYARFPNPASRFPLAGVFVAKTGGTVRVAVTGAGNGGAFRMAAMERALSKSWTPEAVASIPVPTEGLIADIHAGADYRARLIQVMAARAVAEAG